MFSDHHMMPVDWLIDPPFQRFSPVERWNSAKPTQHMRSMFTPSHRCSHNKTCANLDQSNRPYSDASCYLSACLTAQTDLRLVQFRLVPTTRVLIFRMISQSSILHGNLYFCFTQFFVSLFPMKHSWSRLSGLSSQFSPTRRGYEWLICMWTGAFTSIIIETAVACLGGLTFLYA